MEERALPSIPVREEENEEGEDGERRSQDDRAIGGRYKEVLPT